MTRGMNMRDMKARSMGKAEQKPNTGRRGLERGLLRAKAEAPPERPPPPNIDGQEGQIELDEIEEAVHVARGDGHFAPTRRFVRDAEEDRDCPDEPPPGWGEP